MKVSRFGRSISSSSFGGNILYIAQNVQEYLLDQHPGWRDALGELPPMFGTLLDNEDDPPHFLMNRGKMIFVEILTRHYVCNYLW